jgi:hypothetical protein
MTTPTPYIGDPATPYVGPDVYGGPQSFTANALATVTIEEAIRSPIDLLTIQTYVHLLGTDAHSTQTLLGYTLSPLRIAASTVDPVTGDGIPPGPNQTFERWFRVKFVPPFNAVYGIRIWSPNYLPLPGWSVLFGTSTTYQTPTGAVSSIAVNPLPTTDPGPAMPNCGGYQRLPGTGMQYSDWIVMQATADPALAGVGPIQGFTAEGTLIPITFDINWIED